MPLDEALGIAPYQQHSEEVIRLGCLFSLVMPYDLASWLLRQGSGLSVSAASLWNWVQQRGQQVQAEVMEQLQAQTDSAAVTPEPLAASLANLPLAIGADGVMVPFRPTPKTTQGKIRWREVKVGILARLGTRLTSAQERVPQLLHPRLVAVLGDIDEFMPQLQWEARRQAFEAAPQVIWLSDGGRGFWRVYRTGFRHCAVAVLDFFHAAGHLARATQALFGEKRSAPARAWFRCWRHLLRHGRTRDVLRSLTALLNSGLFSGPALDTLTQVQAYFQRHYHHMQYEQFTQQQMPLGSGMVESACKWLIQQRFKGVGMRWSEDGFNHLLLLRLAWVNQRFEPLFSHVPDPPEIHSPDR